MGFNFFKLLECVLGFCNRRVGLFIDCVLAVVWVCIGYGLVVFWVHWLCIGWILGFCNESSRLEF